MLVLVAVMQQQGAPQLEADGTVEGVQVDSSCAVEDRGEEGEELLA